MKVHLICNAHLDPVWQWRWEEGCAETLSTFSTAVTLLREHEGWIFNHNEAVLYRWVERYDPALFLEIQRLVEEGRWSISGGWYLQPDVNMPGTESLIRHILEGRQYFEKRFAVRPRVAYNFDSFGHSGGLPQILRRAGYEMYIHMRPQSPDLDLPSDLYRWRGVDGSEIACLRIAVGLYHTERDNVEQRIREGVDLALELGRDVAVFWGLGNHGGGATREDLERIDACVAREKRVEIVHSTTEHLYESLKAAAAKAPVVSGDLQRVFTGCYTSLSRLKRRARKSLARLTQTEALLSTAWWTRDADYPEAELREAWRDCLFNDFHDILPGSCTEPAEADALDLYGRVAETVRRMRLSAAVALRDGPGPVIPLPLTVLQANPSATRVPVEVECMIDYRPPWKGDWHLRLFALDGTEIISQEEQPEALLPFGGWRRKISFVTDLPAVGVARYALEAREGPRQLEERPPMLAHTFDPGTALVSRLEAGAGRQCLAGPLLEPLLVEDRGDSWGTDCRAYGKVVGRFEALRRCPRVLESGPVRTIRESVLTCEHSRIVLHTLAYAEWPVLEFRLRIHWHEERRRLKLAVPTVFRGAKPECEIPGGLISRPDDGEEHVHGRWFLLEGEVNGRNAAVALVNNGQHGLDARHGEVRISVLRGAAYCHEQGLALGERQAKYMDQGVHEVRLLVTAGDPKAVRELLPGLAAWLEAPPLAYAHLPHGPPIDRRRAPERPREPGATVELLTVRPSSVSLLACKRSRDGRALVLRLQELSGAATLCHLRFRMPDVHAEIHFAPLEIKTLRVERDGQWREVDLVEESGPAG